jgi:hypothetical protein
LKTRNSLCFCIGWILPQSALLYTTFILCIIGRRSVQHKWRNIACSLYNVDGYLLRQRIKYSSLSSIWGICIEVAEYSRLSCSKC